MWGGQRCEEVFGADYVAAATDRGQRERECEQDKIVRMHFCMRSNTILLQRNAGLGVAIVYYNRNVTFTVSRHAERLQS